MIKILLFSIALSFIHSQNTVIAVSDTSTTITTLGNIHSSPATWQNFDNFNLLRNGAIWVWDGTYLVADGVIRKFQKLFWVDCSQASGLLSITADNLYTAYLNGVQIGSGSYQVIDTYQLTLLCGQNNLTVVVTNKDQNSPAGLLFSISQDQSNCYVCQKMAGIGAFYNTQACSCKCLANDYNCPGQTSWMPYPTCGCQCPHAPSLCSSSKYYNSEACKCTCKTSICPTNYVQNSDTCLCQCAKTKECNNKQHWNASTCTCDCNSGASTTCGPNTTWNQESCQCKSLNHNNHND